MQQQRFVRIETHWYSADHNCKHGQVGQRSSVDQLLLNPEQVSLHRGRKVGVGVTRSVRLDTIQKNLYLRKVWVS
jgi:hypothetical protein